MQTKISLVMTGAVSLGSFEAGVLTEVLYAIDYFCKKAKEEGAKEPPFVLDVVTGASAGAMTAGLVSHIVMNDYENKRSYLYKAWVEMVTIDALLENPPTNSLLSQAPIENIAKTCISAPFTTTGKAVFAPEKLSMALTVSNLNGYDRTIAPVVGPAFTSTFFDDRKVFHLDADPNSPSSVTKESTWAVVRSFAIASGAFPFAFAPMRLERNKNEYDDPDLITQFGTWNTYIDGGAFNNQPIGEAVALSREIDQDFLDQPRKYIFVNASSDNSMFIGDDVLSKNIGQPASVAKRVVDAVYSEARTSDFIKAILINDQITYRDKLVDELIEIVNMTTVSNTPLLLEKLQTLVQDIVQSKDKTLNQRTVSKGVEALKHKASKKYEKRYEEKSKEVGPIEEPAKKVLDLIFLALDLVADLQGRGQIELYAIAPPMGTNLAGEQLQAFGGFFREDYRKYNFRVGRSLAYEELTKKEVFGDYPKEQGPAEFQKYDLEPGWETFPNDPLSATPVESRKKLRSILVNQAVAISDEIPLMGWGILDWLTRRLFIRPSTWLLTFYKLKKALEI